MRKKRAADDIAASILTLVGKEGHPAFMKNLLLISRTFSHKSFKYT